MGNNRTEYLAVDFGYQPRFEDVISPWVKYFAWKPVRSEDRGWVWLRRVYRRRLQLKEYIYAPGAAQHRWQYKVTGLVTPDSEANMDSSNSPTEATQERKEVERSTNE